MLWCCVQKVQVNDRRGRLMLPAHLDIVWREALLFPRMYLSMCQMLGVNIINQSATTRAHLAIHPSIHLVFSLFCACSDPLDEELSEWEKQARRQEALDAFKQEFAYDYYW